MQQEALEALSKAEELGYSEAYDLKKDIKTA